MKIKQNLVRFGLPLAGVLLAIAAWRVIAEGKPRVDATPPAITPAQAPSKAAAVAGSGVVEPSSELVAMANAVPGVIAAVLVQPGQTVQRGQPLYTLDDTELRAEAATRRALLASAAQRVTVAEIELKERETSLDLYNRVSDRRAIVQEEMNRREFAVQLAGARLAEVRAAVTETQAALDETQARLSLRTVRAPIAGTVLQSKARAGQFAPAAQLSEPLVTLGQVMPLHVRVDVDEADIARLGALGSAPLNASVSARGSQAPATQATLVRIEPLVVPKRSLTNAVNERVDTRVLQVVFALPKDAKGFSVGQQVDAFIAAGAAP
jgi:multidrug efflux pump subunit AcrA (membrane-fusion protein)